VTDIPTGLTTESVPDEPELPPPAQGPSGPGALLRQARERAGLSVEEVSGQLKLARNTLEALERDDFKTLSEAVYVRGYYRKIAKLLPVSEGELLAAYEALSRPKSALLPQRIPLAGGVAAGSTRNSKGQGIGVFVAIVVVVLVGFLMVDEKPTKRIAENPAPATTATPEAPAPAPTATPEPAMAPEPVIVTPEKAPPVASTAPGPVIVPPAAVVPMLKPPAPAPMLPSATQLTLEFAESSFVRVEDGRNKTLAIGLVRAGEKQVLDGQPPYTVFLGNAQNGKVYYNGQPVDFSAHINRQNDTALFTVP
jgi:cytoskeleton protein RodZ